MKRHPEGCASKEDGNKQKEERQGKAEGVMLQTSSGYVWHELAETEYIKPGRKWCSGEMDEYRRIEEANSQGKIVGSRMD